MTRDSRVLQRFSLTEVYFLGFSWCIKRGDTETHTNREAARAAARPGIAKALPGISTRNQYKESIQGISTRNQYKESVQGINTRNHYKESVQGISTRNQYKESVQGISTRNQYKESVQGITTRNQYKESVQGISTRNQYNESGDFLNWFRKSLHRFAALNSKSPLC